MQISRRRFLLGSVLVTIGGVGLGRYVLQRLEVRSEHFVHALCDHFVPGHDAVPSATSIGIDAEIVELLRGNRRNLLGLLALTRALDARGFDDLTPDEQRRLLAEELEAVATAEAAARPPPRESKTVETIYRECTRRYLTRAESWPALAYRTPQPHGYPDYETCSTS